MSCYLTVLTANSRCLATKSFALGADGSTVKEPARLPKFFRTTSVLIETIYDLAAALTDLSSQPQKIVIRGEILPNVEFEGLVRRLQHDREDAAATFRSRARGNKWVCFDFDKIACPAEILPATYPEGAANYLASLLPAEFQDVTFWAQWSSNAGMDGWKSLSAHLWFMLDRPVTDGDLRLWADATHSPVDTHLFNAVQPHFTAAPIFNGVKDPCQKRNFICRHRRDVASIDLTIIRESKNDGRRISINTREARTNPKADRPNPRIGRAKSRPCDPEMGGRGIEGARSRRRSGAFHGISFEISSEDIELILS
jgi:hypothetical protein